MILLQLRVVYAADQESHQISLLPHDHVILMCDNLQPCDYLKMTFDENFTFFCCKFLHKSIATREHEFLSDVLQK